MATDRIFKIQEGHQPSTVEKGHQPASAKSPLPPPPPPVTFQTSVVPSSKR
jgi:hypothetical protein